MKRNSYIKKFLKNLTACVCFFVLLTGCVLIFGHSDVKAENKTCTEGNYEYYIFENTDGSKYAYIQKYLGNETNISVPDTLGGYPVCGAHLFTHEMEDTERFNQVQSVEFPNTLVNIDGMSCMWFENLTDVTMGEGTEFIGEASFFGCRRLEKLSIPVSVTHIDGEISNNKAITYYVQKGSYADKYLTESGETCIVRTGVKVPVTDLVIEGEKERVKNIEISSPSDIRGRCITAEFTPSNASNRRIKWTVDNEDVIEFDEKGGLNNYGIRMCFSVKKGGQAIITAISDDGGYMAKCIINAQMNIECQEISLSEDTYEYDGTEKKPQVTVGNLIEGEDFSVEYSHNKEPGTGIVTIRGTGFNTGSVTKNFIITPKKEEDKEEGGEGDGSSSSDKVNQETGNQPSVTSEPEKGNTSKANIIVEKPSGFKVKNVKKKKAQIQWKKVKGVDGYEIYRSAKKNGKYSRIKTVKKAGTTKYINSKLKKKGRYYYKIRAYKMVNGKKYYSLFTGAKSIKVKK